MAKPWKQSVRQTGTLSYRLAATLAGAWATAVPWAIAEFNRLSRDHNLGVTLVQADADADPDVLVATASGQVSFKFGGSDHSRTISGTALQGSTVLVGYSGTGTEKAFMYLPAEPSILPPSGRRRPAGSGILKMIALHELIHATGLDNGDHTTQDVFNGYPSADSGRTAAQDRLQIQVQGRYRFMPPTIFSGETARKVRSAWTSR